MKFELFLMLLCFLLASFVVLADETDNGPKGDDHGRKDDKREWPWQKKDALEERGKDGKREWPWQKKNALEGRKEDKREWPWQKKNAIEERGKDGKREWPWQKKNVLGGRKDDKREWPWQKKNALEADETDNGPKGDDVQQAEDPRWGRLHRNRHKNYGGKRDWPWQKKTTLEDQQYFDWPWDKREATDINQGKNLEDEPLQLVS